MVFVPLMAQPSSTGKTMSNSLAADGPKPLETKTAPEPQSTQQSTEVVEKDKPQSQSPSTPVGTQYLRNQSEVIKIFVGHDPEDTWTVHRDLLMAASARAKVLLSSPGKEEKERVIRWPELDATVFGWFVKFLYTTELRYIKSVDMHRLYVLATQLQANRLRDRMYRLLENFPGNFRESQVAYLLENTMPGDLLRFSVLKHLSSTLLPNSDSQYTEGFRTEMCKKYSTEILAMAMGSYSAVFGVEEPEERSAKRPKLDTRPSLFTTPTTASPAANTTTNAALSGSGFTPNVPNLPSAPNMTSTVHTSPTPSNVPMTPFSGFGSCTAQGLGLFGQPVKPTSTSTAALGGLFGGNISSSSEPTGGLFGRSNGSTPKHSGGAVFSFGAKANAKPPQ